MKRKTATQILYPKKDGSDTSLSIYSAIMMYRGLMRKGNIKADGAAANRLKQLEKMYDSGTKFFGS